MPTAEEIEIELVFFKRDSEGAVRGTNAGCGCCSYSEPMNYADIEKAIADLESAASKLRQWLISACGLSARSESP